MQGGIVPCHVFQHFIRLTNPRSHPLSVFITTTVRAHRVATYRSMNACPEWAATGTVKSARKKPKQVTNRRYRGCALGANLPGGQTVNSHHGPWIDPSITPQVRRSLRTGSPFSSATASALSSSLSRSQTERSARRSYEHDRPRSTEMSRRHSRPVR